MDKSHGHRVFGVVDAKVQELIARTIEKTGLEELRRFISGATTQVVFGDGTVVNLLDRSKLPPGLPSSAMSLPVKDPSQAASELADELRAAGYDAVQFEPIPDLPPGSFVMVQSPALEGWLMAFRSPVIDQIEEDIAQ